MQACVGLIPNSVWKTWRLRLQVECPCWEWPSLSRNQGLHPACIAMLRELEAAWHSLIICLAPSHAPFIGLDPSTGWAPRKRLLVKHTALYNKLPPRQSLFRAVLACISQSSLPDSALTPDIPNFSKSASRNHRRPSQDVGLARNAARSGLGDLGVRFKRQATRDTNVYCIHLEHLVDTVSDQQRTHV